MILMGPFQLSLFCDSGTLFMKQTKKTQQLSDFTLLMAPLPLAGRWGPSPAASLCPSALAAGLGRAGGPWDPYRLRVSGVSPQH